MNTSSLFKKTIHRYKLVRRGDMVLLGISGGPDSMALLNLFQAVRHEFGLTLHALHINHHLRADAKKDEVFVVNECTSKGIPWTVKSIRIHKRPRKSSIEDLAREKRLDCFEKVAAKIQADCIALGHHQNDLAETVLMRILRGSGLRGLQGIKVKNQIRRHTFIRPLLYARKEDILSYLKKSRIPFCRDSTNSDLDFTRNKIRHKLIPLLERDYNPDFSNTLANLADNVSRDYEFLDKQAAQKFHQLAKVHPAQKCISFPLKPFSRLDSSMQNMLARISVEHLKGDLNRLESRHLQDLTKVLSTPADSTQLNWPQGIRVNLKRGELAFLRRKA